MSLPIFTAYNYDLITTHTNLCVNQFVDKIKEENIVIVDTRSKEEYESWNVPNSINIQIDKIEENIDKLPKGKKSYAMSFILQDSSKTLTDKQIDKTMANLVEAFAKATGAELRS